MKDKSLNKNPHLGFLNNIDWMNAQASEIFISVNDRNHPELPVLSASQEWGMIYRDEGGMNIFHDVANEITYKRVRPGQFVIHLRSFQGGFAHSKVEGITSPAYTILDFKDKNKHNDLFWKYVLTSEEFIKRLELITYGIRDGRSINFSDFSTLNFYFPSYEVQLKIGTFLSHVDSLIQAKTKKLESFKAVKKSLLQKCFPKAGEKVPEMRFESNKEWASINFEDCFSFLSNNSFSRDELNYEKGYIKSLHYGDVLIKFGEILNVSTASLPYITQINAPKQYSKSILKNGDIVIADAAEDNTVGKCTEIQNCTELLAAGLHTIAVRPKIEFAPTFLGFCINSESFHNQLLPLIQGTKVSSISKSAIVATVIYYPISITEQQKIGQFFSKYDSLISAQQKEIDKLKDIKKSLLQKMFV